MITPNREGPVARRIALLFLAVASPRDAGAVPDAVAVCRGAVRGAGHGLSGGAHRRGGGRRGGLGPVGAAARSPCWSSWRRAPSACCSCAARFSTGRGSAVCPLAAAVQLYGLFLTPASAGGSGLRPDLRPIRDAARRPRPPRPDQSRRGGWTMMPILAKPAIIWTALLYSGAGGRHRDLGGAPNPKRQGLLHRRPGHRTAGHRPRHHVRSLQRDSCSSAARG